MRSLAVEELDYRIRAEQLVRKRLQRAKAEGDLPKDSSPADLARYLRAVICGMAVQSRRRRGPEGLAAYGGHGDAGVSGVSENLELDCSPDAMRYEVSLRRSGGPVAV